MGATGPGCGGGIGLLRLIDGRDLRCRWYAEALDVGTFSTGSKPGTRNAEAPIEGIVIVSHLSKTARVNTHCDRMMDGVVWAERAVKP